MAYGGIEVQHHSLLIYAMDRGEWSALQPDFFIPGEMNPDAL
jgi:hypothetical protein